MDFNSWTKSRLINWIASRRALTQCELNRMSKKQLVAICKALCAPCLASLAIGRDFSCGRCSNCRNAKQHLHEALSCLKK